MKPENERELELIKRLMDRLEHLSVDSTYAHRASGLRGSLLRYVERYEVNANLNRTEQKRLGLLIQEGFHILELAAKEIGRAK